MDRTHIALSCIVAGVVLLGPVVWTGFVGPAAAAVEDPADRPDAYAVEQGTDCIQIEPVGDADTDVVSHYDYRPNADDKWSSHGTTDRQESQVSQLYVYRGTDGDSLVFLHDELNDDEGGGGISMTISGLPEAASWVVEDDDYDGRDDRFQHGGSASQIDWMWHPERTDGGAVRGIAEPGYDEITIDPAFGEDSYAATQGWRHAEDDLEWRVDNGNGSLVSLERDEPITLSHGACSGASPPDAELTANPESPDAGENVTLDASGSADEDGITTYRWDVDGDGEFDAETDDPTYVTSYDDEGEVVPTVEVEDGTGASATAAATVRVQQAVSVTAVADVPGTARAGEPVTLDGSNSTGSVDIDSYEWTIEGGTELTGEVVPHEFTSGGMFDVTLTVRGDGATDQTTTQIEVTDDDPPTAALDAPGTAEVGETITLDASASTDDMGVAEYRWDVDGNGSTDETTESPQLEVSYDEAGEHSPTVAVIDDRGGIDEASTTIEVTSEDDDSDDQNDSDGDSGGAGGGGGGSLPPPGTPSISVANASVASSTVEVGGQVQIPTTLANDGDGDGTTDLNLTVDGTVVDTTAVFVAADDTQSVQLDHRFEDAGTYALRVNDVDAGSVTVVDEPGDRSTASGPGDGNVVLEDFVVSDEPVVTGTPTDIDATYENRGERTVTFDATLLVDGEVASTQNVSVPAGEARTITFEHAFTSPGTYDVEIDGTERSLVVGGDAAGTPAETRAGGFPGPIHVAVGVAALLAVVVALSRWI